MAQGKDSNSFEDETIRIVGVIKNTAELLTITGLFSFIAKTYSSAEARIINYVLLVALGAYLSANIQHYLLEIPKRGHKHFGKILLLVAAVGLMAAVATQVFILTPTIRAIERQLGATPAASALQAVPARTESAPQTSASTAAPKPAAIPAAVSAPKTAPAVVPKAGQNGSSSRERLKPD